MTLMQQDIFEIIHPDFDTFLIDKLREESDNSKKDTQTFDDRPWFSSIIRSIAAEVFKRMDSICYPSRLDSQLDVHCQNLNQIWKSGFQYSDILYQMLADTYQLIETPEDSEHIKDVVLDKILGKGLRTYAEIFLLLRNGYPYGATALTRILFELMVYYHFIMEHDDNLAMSFYNASENPMTENEKFEWARNSGCFNKKESINFGKIRENSGLENINNSLNSNYAYYCKFSHSASQTIINEFGDSTNDIFIGPTIYGIHIHAIYSTITLCDILAHTLYRNKNDKFTWRSIFCLEWSFLLIDAYNSIADNLDQRWF